MYKVKYLKILSALLIFGNVGFSANYMDLDAYLDRCDKRAIIKKQKEEEQNVNICRTNSLPKNIISKVKNDDQIYYSFYKYNPTFESIVDRNAQYNYCYVPLFYKTYDENTNKKEQNNKIYYYQRIKVGEKENKEYCTIF